MNTAAYLLSQSHYSSECSFCITEATKGFPISYASAGFVDMFGFKPAECVGKNCGSLVGGARIKGDKCCLAFAGDICGLSLESVEQAIDIITTSVRDVCLAVHANSEEHCNLCLVLNRRKTGELFVCEFRIRTFIHPEGWPFSVGFQYDVTNHISIMMLLHAALSNELHVLVKRHAARVGPQRLFMFGSGTCFGVNEEYLQLKAEETCQRQLQIRSLSAVADLACLLAGWGGNAEQKSSRKDGCCAEIPSTAVSENLWSRVAVVRHGERADAIWGHPWTDSSDADVYPFDPPITQTGLAQVEKLAADLNQCGPFDIVVSSPFLRCIQTSLLLADILGAKLLIDNGLGEMFTPELFGEHASLNNPLRTLQDLASALDSMKCHLKNQPSTYWEKVVGSPPVWPETGDSARRRYAWRFLTYLKRTRTTRQNYVLVGHQGLLEEALHLLPATSNAQVNSVDYCASLVAMWPHEHDMCEDEVTWSRARSVSFNDSGESMLEEIPLQQEELSATKLRTQTERWEVGVQGIDLHKARSFRRRRSSKGRPPSINLQKLLGKNPQSKAVHASIRELVNAVAKNAHSWMTLEVADHLSCLSSLTISDVPHSTTSDSPGLSPLSTKAPKSPFCARKVDQMPKAAALDRCKQACKMTISASSLLTRRASSS